MDPCKCWRESVITIRVRHCPSLEGEIRAEVDKIVQIATDKDSKLSHLGKVKLEVTSNEITIP